jgi:hypothetical protein
MRLVEDLLVKETQTLRTMGVLHERLHTAVAACAACAISGPTPHFSFLMECDQRSGPLA